MEHNNPPPLPAAKRNLCSATTAQTANTDIALTGQEKLSKASFMAVPRVLFEKEGFLKAEEQITAESLYNVFKLICKKHNNKMPSKIHKTTTAFRILLGIHAAEKNTEKAPNAEESVKKISEKVEEAIDRGITKLSKVIESSLTEHKNIQDSSKRMKECMAAIHKALEQVDKNLAVVSDSSNKLTNMVSSYKEVLLMAPKPVQQTHIGNQVDSTDLRIIRDQNQKVCQVLVDIYNKDVTNQSLEELKSNFNTLIREEPMEPLSDANVQHIIKLRNGGLILQFEMKEIAEWFRQPEITSSILPKIDKMAALKDRTFQLLVPRVPVIFDPDSDESLRELKEQNSLKEGELCKARWIKPTYRRAIGQCAAHLALLVSTPEAANVLIRDGVYICGTVAHPRKLKTESKQCMKCRKWGHFAAECLEVKDACGNCAEDHHMKNCPDKNRRYCVSCQNDTHASWDRNCLEFKCRVECMDETTLKIP